MFPLVGPSSLCRVESSEEPLSRGRQAACGEHVLCNSIGVVGFGLWWLGYLFFYGARCLWYCLASKPSKSFWGSGFEDLKLLAYALSHPRFWSIQECAENVAHEGANRDLSLCADDPTFPNVPEGGKGLAGIGESSANLDLAVSGCKHLGAEVSDLTYLGAI